MYVLQPEVSKIDSLDLGRLLIQIRLHIDAKQTPSTLDDVRVAQAKLDELLQACAKLHL